MNRWISYLFLHIFINSVCVLCENMIFISCLHSLLENQCVFIVYYIENTKIYKDKNKNNILTRYYNYNYVKMILP